MLLRQLIQTRLNSSFRIFNREGNLQDPVILREEYARIRQYLLDYHTDQKTPIVICLVKDYRYLFTMLACMEVGIPYIPVTIGYPADRLEQIKADSQFQILIDEKKITDILNYTEKRLSDLPKVKADDTIYVMFTSGSTGKPKGVTIQRRALENFFTFLKDGFPEVTEIDRILQVTDFTFDISLVDVGVFLLKNSELHFSQFEKDIFRFAYEIETREISFINTVPNNLNMFLSDAVAGRTEYKSLKHLLIAGGRFSFGLYQKCHTYLNLSVNVYNFYGPTESTVYSHGHKLSFDEREDCIDQVVSIGKVLPGLTALVNDGELYIGGRQLLKEYINNPAQTNKALVMISGELMYRTGDLAFKSDDKYFVIGRCDETIKYRGYRINLLDIDSYISRLPYVEDSVTIAIPDELIENQTVAFIILKEAKTVSEVKEDLKQLLLEFQIPNNIVFVKSYPTNDSGKVDRKLLRDTYEE